MNLRKDHYRVCVRTARRQPRLCGVSSPTQNVLVSLSPSDGSGGASSARSAAPSDRALPLLRGTCRSKGSRGGGLELARLKEFGRVLSSKSRPMNGRPPHFDFSKVKNDLSVGYLCPPRLNGRRARALSARFKEPSVRGAAHRLDLPFHFTSQKLYFF